MKAISADTSVYTLRIPTIDKGVFEFLAKKFGWTATEKKTGLDKALEDVAAGRIYKAKDSQDLINQILD